MGEESSPSGAKTPTATAASTLPNNRQHPDLARNESAESHSSADSDNAMKQHVSSDEDEGPDPGELQFTPAISSTPHDDMQPTLSSSGTFSWAPPGQQQQPQQGPRSGRSMTSSSGGTANELSPVQTNQSVPSNASRSGRPPAAARTPSNAYAPYVARRPTQYSVGSNRQRTSSANRARRANPNAEYRAQERAYVQRIRQDVSQADDYVPTGELRTPSLDFSSDTNTDDGSPSTAEPMDDPYEQDTLLAYGIDEMQPSVEELKIPQNRERLEWHSMLASVLTGDVVNQEKKRLISGGDLQHNDEHKAEIWLGLRSKICGRTLQSQRRMVEKGRSEINSILESVIAFEIKGVFETGKTAAEQVADIVQKIEKCESLYPNYMALKAAHPRITSTEYVSAYEAIIAWHNIMQLIDTELAILRLWVGNESLNFSIPREREGEEGRLADESSFIERILKEDGLKSLQSKEGLLVGLSKVINQAKRTLIAHAEAIQTRHLPPYIEELQTLINFPSRLVKEIIRIRLSYAKKIKDLSQQPVMTTEQMIGQFQILLTLAARIKDAYNKISRPEPGWEPPDCIEENFDVVVVDALKFYFKLLNWKLSANKNAFKEAEIMESEWDFSTKVGRCLDGGDVEVAEQFWYVIGAT
jgi:mitogen-activated protein kinase kinase kinase